MLPNKFHQRIKKKLFFISQLVFTLNKCKLTIKVTNKRSNLQIITLCIGFFGIQIGFALQAGNLTRILQNYGANLQQASLLWLIAPLVGMIIQPLIGHISDKWINKGKTRTPFLLMGGLLSAITLIALPNADLFIIFFPPLLFGAFFIFLTDSAFNISMHPLRATISDYLPREQQGKGFTIQTFLISIGAIIGSGLPYILHNVFDFSSTTTLHQIPSNVKWSFYIGGITILVCMLINVKAILHIKPTISTTNTIPSDLTAPPLSLRIIPATMWKIGLIQFFSWSAFFLLWVYMTPAIAQHYYDEYNHLPSSNKYAEAADYTGILFSVYHVSASIFALLLPFLYRKINLINSHIIALSLGALGLVCIYVSKDTAVLIPSMLLVGIAWASILATPFILLSRYTSKKKIGLYFGIFNLFITIPQILNGLVSGFIIEKIFDNKAIIAILLAAIALLLAALSGIYYRKELTHGGTTND